MEVSTERRTRLRRFDEAVGAFESNQGAGRIDMDVRRDIEAVLSLAQSVVETAQAWIASLARLEYCGDARTSLERATALILESLFDDALNGPAWRLLAAAADLARSDPCARP